MKDLYSFHADEDDLKRYYEIMKKAYKSVFKRVGLGSHTFVTFASGGSFSKYSHEYQTITEAGEDTIYLCEKCEIGINKEIFQDQKICPECGGSIFKEETSIEVGNIFDLKTKFSSPFNLSYKNKEGDDSPVLMGCFGIGLGRLLGAVVEVLSDERGIVWPESIAPFAVHLVALGENRDVLIASHNLYKKLLSKNIDVLFDDTNSTAGEKFANADLMGIPHRVVVSEKTLKAKKFELKNRKTGKVSLLSQDKLFSVLLKAK